MSTGARAADPPSWRAAANARTLLGPVLRAAFRIRVNGADRVPAAGPLLFVAGHPGAVDAVLLAGTAPRPVHVVTDPGPWPEPLDRWSRRVGEITIDPVRGERAALHRAAEVLTDGRAVAVFPEGRIDTGSGSRATPFAGLLLARAPVPVVPVAVFGTRGRHPADPPRLRSTIDLAFGDPVTLDLSGVDPLRRVDVLRVTEAIRQVLADHVAVTARRTGRRPAGPVPEDGGRPGIHPEAATRGPRT